MQSLLESLGEQSPPDADSISNLLDYLRTERRHQVASADDLDGMSLVPDLVREVYSSLDQWQSLSSEERLTRIERWRHELCQ